MKSNKNSSEAKFFPKSSYTRNVALMMAKLKRDQAMNSDILMPRTRDRLDAIQPLFRAGLREINNKKAELATLMSQKEKLKAQTLMFCAHYHQVFNFCIKRGEYQPAMRGYFGLPIENDVLPSMKREWEIVQAAESIVKGEQLLVAAGGTPMSRPSAAEVQVKYLAYKDLISRGSNAKDALDNAQEALQKLNKETDAVIKKVWSEVQSFYNELPREGMREHGRAWGVVYARKGILLTVNGTVTDAATGLPLAGAKLQFANGRNKVTTNSEGKFSIGTTLMHEQPLTAKLKDYETAETIVHLTDKTVVCNLTMSRVS